MKLVPTGRRIAGVVACAALFALPCAASLAASPAPATSPSPELSRGRALYELRCDQCHDQSVHQRTSRKAKNFSEVRASVVRWDRQQGGSAWRDDEVDLVTRYLNNRYYKFPCPASVCGSSRAQGTDRTVPVHNPVALR
jgi:cytochrome c-type biogenesis protein CcmH/NrfF